MYFTLMGKLSARRKNLATQDDKGFTLIELLVVVIIIGILAAIAIPVYLGVQNNAKDSAVQSDVTNLKTALISAQTNGTAIAAKSYGTLSDLTTAKLTDGGATFSSNTGTLVVSVGTSVGGNTPFCIQGTGKDTKTNFAATDALGVAKGTCAAGVFTATP